MDREDEQHYSILVDGKVSEKEVPPEDIAVALSSYGVGRAPTLSTLLTGQELRIHGQNIRVVAHNQSAEVSPAIKSEYTTPPGRSDQYDYLLQELKGRGDKIGSKAMLSGIAAAGTAVVGGALYLAAVFSEPSLSISEISVPTVVLEAFQIEGRGLSEVESLSDQMVAFMTGIAMRSFTTILGVMIIGFGIMSGRLTNILPAFGIILIPHVFGAMFDVSFPEAERPAFHTAVEQKSMTDLQGHLLNRPLPVSAVNFVLAQASIIEGRSSPWLTEASQDLKSSDYDFEVPPQIRYAIEASPHAMTRGPLSDVSQQYVEDRESTATWLRRFGTVMLVAGGILGLLSAGKGLAAAVIRRRLRRINNLLKGA